MTQNTIQMMLETFRRNHPNVMLDKSTIAEQDITNLEARLDLALPEEVKSYLRAYTFPVPFVTGKMLGDFSQTYDEATGSWRELAIEEDVATVILHLPLMLPDFDLETLVQLNRPFAQTGYLWLGVYNDEYDVLLDAQSGSIYRADPGRIRLKDARETKEAIIKWALPFFASFHDLTRCFFAGEIYDEDEQIFVEG